MKKPRIKKHNKRISIFLIMLVLLTPTNFVAAESEGISAGAFNVTSAYNSSSIQVMETGTTNASSYLMPQQSYDIKVNFNNNKGIGSLDSLEVKMWLDSLGNQIKESHFNVVQPADGATSARIKWSKSTNTVLLDAGGDTTWKLLPENCTLPSTDALSDLTITQYEFIFRVTIGKVARMTVENSKWMIAYQTTDISGTNYGYYSVNGNPGIEMEWYCEVEAPQNIEWGNIMPGISYEDEIAKQKVEKVKYISNGIFNEQVKFDTAWKDKDEKVAKLTEDPLNSNEFALKVNNTDNLGSAKQIPCNGDFVITAENSAPTTYEGTLKEDYHFYIKLNKSFDMGMYTGRITFGVSNGF